MNFYIKLESLSHKDIFFGWNWCSASGEDDFLKFRWSIFTLRYYHPLERGRAFPWTNLNLIHPKMLCTKFGWNCPIGSGVKFLNFVNIFFTISLLSTLGKGRCPSFEQTWIPFTHIALRQVWLKFRPCGSGEDLKILLKNFRYIKIIFPWKRAEPIIWKKTWIPFTQGYFVPSLVEIGPVVL